MKGMRDYMDRSQQGERKMKEGMEWRGRNRGNRIGEIVGDLDGRKTESFSPPFGYPQGRRIREPGSECVVKIKERKE